MLQSVPYLTLFRFEQEAVRVVLAEFTPPPPPSPPFRAPAHQVEAEFFGVIGGACQKHARTQTERCFTGDWCSSCPKGSWSFFQACPADK